MINNAFLNPYFEKFLWLLQENQTIFLIDYPVAKQLPFEIQVTVLG